MIPLQVLRGELRLGDVTTDDDLIMRYEAGAVAYLERETGQYFGPRKTYTQFWEGGLLDWLPQGELVLEYSTVTDVWAAAADYTFAGRVVTFTNPYTARLYPSTAIWRATYPIGFDPGKEPADIREAVIMVVQHRYESRTKGELGVIPEELDSMLTRLIRLHRRTFA